VSSLKTVLKTIARVLNASWYTRAALKEPVLQCGNSNVIKYISSRVYTLKNMNGFPFYPMRTLGKNTRENFVSKNSSLIVHVQLLFLFKRGACLSLVKARDGFETRRHLFSRSRFFFFFFGFFFFSVKGEFFGRNLWGCSGRELGQ